MSFLEAVIFRNYMEIKLFADAIHSMKGWTINTDHQNQVHKNFHVLYQFAKI